MRVKSKWNREREHSLHDLENEGFQTDTNTQRLDIMAEFLAFLVHLADRLKAEQLDQQERQAFITSLALHLADRMQENRADIQGKGTYRQPLIDLLNARAADYAEFAMVDDEPGYAFKRYFGEKVRAVMGAKDNQWITDQVIDIEVPETLPPLNKALRDLFA